MKPCPSTGFAIQIAVVIEPAHSLVYARLRASLDGLDQGEFTEGHEQGPQGRYWRAPLRRRPWTS